MLWCKNQIEHSIWDESLLFSNCARSLEYSTSSTLAGLSYHICGKLEVAFKASPSSQHQHCTDEAQKAETVLSAVIYIYRKMRLMKPTHDSLLLRVSCLRTHQTVFNKENSYHLVYIQACEKLLLFA